MALNSTGPLSFGGSTTGQSINLELGVSATALASINSSSFRTLAGVASGQISIFNFYGKSNSSYFIAFYNGNTGPTGGACTDSSGTFCATNDFENGTGFNILQISSTGTFIRWNNYSGSAIPRGVCPTAVGTTLYCGWRAGTGTPGQVGVVSINSSTGAIIAGGGASATGGTSTVTHAGKIGIDSSGNMFVGGYFNQFGVNHSTLMAFNSSGVLQASQKPSPIGIAARIPGVVVDSSNNIYCFETGQTGGDAYVVKLTYSAGTFTKIWTSQGGFSSQNNLQNAFNWIFVQGSFVYVCITPSPSSAGYVYKLNTSDGSRVWGRAFTTVDGGSDSMILSSISADSSDNVYVFGTARVVSGQTYRRPFVVKLNSAGTTQFIRAFNSNNTTASWETGASTVDSSGNMNMSMQNYATYFLMKLPTDGTKTGTYTIGAATLTYAAVTINIGNDNNFSSVGSGGGLYSLNNAGPSFSTGSTGLTTTTTIVP